MLLGLVGHGQPPPLQEEIRDMAHMVRGGQRSRRRRAAGGTPSCKHRAPAAHACPARLLQVM